MDKAKYNKKNTSSIYKEIINYKDKDNAIEILETMKREKTKEIEDVLIVGAG